MQGNWNQEIRWCKSFREGLDQQGRQDFPDNEFMVVLEFQDKPIDWILIDESAVAASERGFNQQTFTADRIPLR